MTILSMRNQIHVIVPPQLDIDRFGDSAVSMLRLEEEGQLEELRIGDPLLWRVPIQQFEDYIPGVFEGRRSRGRFAIRTFPWFFGIDTTSVGIYDFAYGGCVYRSEEKWDKSSKKFEKAKRVLEGLV